MRFLLIAGAGIILFLGTSTVPAQKTKEQQKKPAPDTQILEIGGKTLEQWMKEIPSKDRSRGENAIRTILGFGADRAYEAVPVLITELKKQTNGPITLDVSISVNAVIALGVILGEAEKPDPKVVNDAVKVLTAMLQDSQSIVKYRSAEALGKIGPRSKTAIPQLLTLLHDTRTWETRQAAATSLGFIVADREGKKGPPENVLKGLYGALKDPSFQVRLAAIRSMTFIGTPANATEKDRDVLVGYLKPRAESEKEDPTVRIWAHMAIMSLNRELSQEHVQAITDMLKNHEMAARVQAAQALAMCGQSAFGDQENKAIGNPQAAVKTAIPRLVAGLDDKEAIVAMNCMIALTKMGKEGKRAIPVLREIAKDMKRPEGLRQAATQTAEFLNTITAQAAPKQTAPKENPKNNAAQK